MKSVVIIDHKDSFTDNLARYVRLCNANCIITKFNEIPDRLDATHIIISPGPLAPYDYPQTQLLLRKKVNNTPILGICLGHQMIGLEFGLELKKSEFPNHGRSISLSSYSGKLFTSINTSFEVGCYNSLILSDSILTDHQITITARNDLGEIMALQHNSLPIFGVQFHPESIMTQNGLLIIKNFLEI